MASLFDVFGRLLLDDKGFQADVQKSADKAGQTMGQRMTSGLGDVLKRGAFAGFAAGAALATKGVVELENVTANFRAETGATAEEAEQAGKAINAMAGSNLVPMAEIGQALADVTTNMGVSGDEAEALTLQFVKFGRATKQNTSVAVKKFDDILDAWNLTAADSGELMDKLVVSHQKYGGSIEDNEAALAALAPALQAANLTIDDGIGLLNLFESAGVDSAVAVTGMQKALAKVKSPEELQRLIDDISNTEDPFLRAQKAADLFGTKAGTKLSQALKPGMGALDDFKVSLDESRGATREAADALDSTFGSRVQLLLKGFTSKLIELGGQFGPVLLGLSSLASLAGSLGLDKVLAGVFKKLGVTALVTNAAKSAGAAIGGIFGTAVASAGKLAELVAEHVSDIAHKAFVKLAASRAGSAVGAIFGTAMGGFTKLGEMLSGALLRIPGMPKVQSAARLAGAKVGLAFQIGFVLALAELASILEPEVEKLGAQVHDAIFGDKGPLGFLGDPLKEAGTWLRNLPWPLGPVGAPDWAAGERTTATGVAGIRQALDTAFGKPVTFDLTDDIKAEMESGALAVQPAAEAVGAAIEGPITDGAQGATDSVETATQAILTALGALRSELGAAAAAAAGAIFDPILKEAELAQTKLDIAEQTRIIKDKDSTKAQVREARLRRTELQKQLFLQISDLTTYGTDAERISAIKAALASESVAEAYRDGTPEQRAAIDEWRRVMSNQLTKLEGQATTGGDKTAGNYAGALEDGKGDITAGAKTAVSGVNDAFQKGKDSRRWGSNVGQAWISGASSSLRNGRDDIYAAVLFAAAGLHGKSPPKVGPLREIDTWGTNVMLAWADGMVAARQAVRKAAMLVAGAAAPQLALESPALGMPLPVPGASHTLTPAAAIAGSQAAPGSTTINNNVALTGLVKARNPLEIVGEMSRLSSLGVLTPRHVEPA